MEQRGSGLIVHLVITLLIMMGIAFVPVIGSDTTPAKKSVKLPVVGSFSKLKSLLKDSEIKYRGYQKMLTGRPEALMDSAPSNSERSADSASGPSDYSKTNVQVQGVDEADIVKTDGKYIYKISESKLSIVLATPTDRMKVVGEIPFSSGEFRPQEIYVDKNYVIVIGQASGPIELKAPEPGVSENEQLRQMNTQTMVKALVFDTSDKANPRKTREVEIEGSYLTSRKIGSAVYLVANKDLDYYTIMEETKDKQNATPIYHDSAQSDEYKRVGFSQIRYFPQPSQPNYLLVAGFNLDEPDREMKVNTYLGAGQNVYASQKNLYVAAAKPGPSPTGGTNTGVYRFALNDGETVFMSQGEVPGTILNQFSMDEHSGYFRIATTEQRLEPSDGMSTENNLFVLDSDLEIAGKITDIAPGESIYSVRFMGERAYMVTFKKVDPLFVIDLKDPSNPRIQGELKIPGYSDYLHIYDENHIIGFGKDAVGAESSPGMPESDFAYYQGMKIAVFDVSNVERPVEKFKTIIGDRGTESELLRNHKALLFDKDRNLLAFPITVMEIEGGPTTGIAPEEPAAYGKFTFQGAYVYDIDLNTGLKLRAKITHRRTVDDDRDYSSGGAVKRVLRIDNTLYTVSDEMIKANDLKTLKEKTRVIL
ncbi:MAG TPA: hypothetical protein ENI11_05280 [Actinobacteria bacterium]|nr:hypothetical protein [Actinomycetota bacterium]